MTVFSCVCFMKKGREMATIVVARVAKRTTTTNVTTAASVDRGW